MRTRTRSHAPLASLIAMMGAMLVAGSPAYTQTHTTGDQRFDLIARTGIQGKDTVYHGYRCVEFTFEGRTARIVAPTAPAAGHPWLWRARFWGHEPQAELALLARGFHLVFIDTEELFGNAENIAIWDRFYRMLTGGGLAPRAAHIGFSRGGLYVYLWALSYPERVACVYADAPALDFRSWPGGRIGKGGNSPLMWERFKKEFGFRSDEEAVAWRGSPLDRAEEIAAGGYPMLHVCGDADAVVPIGENTDPFEARVLAAGGRITVIRKPGVGHHPHSLADPTPIVDFIVRAAAQRP